MKPQLYLHASRSTTFSRPRLPALSDLDPDTGASGGVAQAIGRRVALAIALPLLLGQGALFAQQALPPGQGSSRNDPYNGQYAPDQQSRYGQQPYAQQPGLASGQVDPQQGYEQSHPPVQPLNAERLEQLVAPIALYPDTLLAQVLAASTYPAQVEDAAHWRLAQGYASADQIADGADVQTWDPSVKALTAFPQVLAQMDRSLQWTTDLGNAYYNQPQDVLEAVQAMRQRARAAGTLQSTPEETVSYDQGNIELAPANSQVVYVPAYNPWGIYGEPISPYPGFSQLGGLGSFFGSSPVNYGLGILMTAFSHTPWGWLAWGLNWLSQSVLFHNANYFSSSTTVANWGFPHGGGRLGSGFPVKQGPRFVPRPAHGFTRPGNGYNATRGPGFVPRPPGSYSRPGSVYTAARGSGFVPRPPGSYDRPGGGYNMTRGGFVPRPPDRYAGTRLGEGSSHGYQTSGAGHARPPLEAYNHIQPTVSRQQQYDRPPQASRTLQRADFGKGSSVGRGFAGYSGKPAHSGGSPLFGGGHSSKNFYGGGHAPKHFSSGKNFSSRHSGGGGHSGGHGSGRHHH